MGYAGGTTPVKQFYTEATGTLRYQFKGGTAAGDLYQEYIASSGIKFDNGMYIEFQSSGGGIGATESV